MKSKFELFQTAVEKGYSSAQTSLGYYVYEKGKAFYWYTKVIENRCEVAPYNLGRFHEFGTCVDKDEKNGFKNAKFQLGFCCVNGIGTGINKEIGFELYNEDKVNYWYQRSAEIIVSIV